MVLLIVIGWVYSLGLLHSFMQPANSLKIESLNEGWCDKDHVLLHACFQLLIDFVEKEMRVQDHPDWNATEESRNAKKEIEALYAWWQQRKNDAIMDRSGSFIEDHVIYAVDNAMLKRLVDIRMHLWS